MFDSMRRTSIGSSMSFESAVNSIWDLHKQLTKSFVTGILEAIAILIHKGPSIPNPSKLFYTFVSFHLYLSAKLSGHTQIASSSTWWCNLRESCE